MEGILALFIPIMALSIPFFAIWTKHQRRLAEMQIMAGTSQTTTASAEAAQRLKALEDRVRVLERIVTDANANGSLSLAHEIEALRGTEPGVSPSETRRPAALV